VKFSVALLMVGIATDALRSGHRLRTPFLR
jgi:hypothetical protein